MGVALLLAMATPTAPVTTARPVVSAQANASVRIVRGAVIRFGRSASAGSWSITRASVRRDDGGRQPATLIEFE